MFQVGRNNLVNLGDYAIIESDDDIEEDDVLQDFIIRGEEEQQQSQGTQRPATRQLKILQGPQLRHLGEGSVHFWTSETVSGHFAEYKNGMRNVNDVVLEEHPEPRRRAMTISTTWNCEHYTKKEVERIEY